jgi:hypothetical protein
MDHPNSSCFEDTPTIAGVLHVDQQNAASRSSPLGDDGCGSWLCGFYRAKVKAGRATIAAGATGRDSSTNGPAPGLAAEWRWRKPPMQLHAELQAIRSIAVRPPV